MDFMVQSYKNFQYTKKFDTVCYITKKIKYIKKKKSGYLYVYTN